MTIFLLTLIAILNFFILMVVFRIFNIIEEELDLITKNILSIKRLIEEKF